MKLYKFLIKIFSLPDLRKRVLVVLFILSLTRLLAVIPLPGVNVQQLLNFFGANQALNLLNLFTGGGLSNVSVALMGVGPYITASIIFQLLSYVIPSLEAMQKEGEAGRQKINQYTRLATIPLAIIQSFGTLTLLRNSGVIDSWNPTSLLLMLVISTAGSILLMWMGELISEYGIGNGVSLIITLGIIAGFASSFSNSISTLSFGNEQVVNLIGFLVISLITLAVVVIVNEGVRNIPVTYAKNIRGQGLLGRANAKLPIKINSAGVIPIIFAISIVLVPPVAAQLFQNSDIGWLANTSDFILKVFDQSHWFYSTLYFAMVFAFTYFYTFIIIKPEDMAENLQRQGGFIPGVRPGNDTAKYIYDTVNKLTFPGALFLATIAVLPVVIQNLTSIETLSLGGTSILIVVSVSLETLRQLETQIATRTYESNI